MFDHFRRRDPATDGTARERLRALAARAPLPSPTPAPPRTAPPDATVDRDRDEWDWVDESEVDEEPAGPGRKPDGGARWWSARAILMLPARRRVWLALAGTVAATAVVAGTAIAVFSRPAREIAPVLPAVPAAPQVVRSAVSAAQTGGTIVVSVVGKVARPGLVTLPDGARVDDAVRAAGGAASGVDLTGLNLARRLSDGEQVNVGVPPPADAGAGQSLPGAPAKVDLNSAGLAQLDGLPGVGQVTAQRILDWRTRRGRFTSVEQLREIEGIGETRFARLRELVTVR